MPISPASPDPDLFMVCPAVFFSQCVLNTHVFFFLRFLAAKSRQKAALNLTNPGRPDFARRRGSGDLINFRVNIINKASLTQFGRVSLLSSKSWDRNPHEATPFMHVRLLYCGQEQVMNSGECSSPAAQGYVTQCRSV